MSMITACCLFAAGRKARPAICKYKPRLLVGRSISTASIAGTSNPSENTSPLERSSVSPGSKLAIAAAWPKGRYERHLQTHPGSTTTPATADGDIHRSKRTADALTSELGARARRSWRPERADQAQLVLRRQ